MYNEEIKKRYLDLQTSDYNNFKYLFNQTEKFEKKLDDDLFDIPTEIVLTEILKQGKITSYQSFKKKYGLIKQYKLWAIANNLIDPERKYIEGKIKLRELFLKHNQNIILKTPKQLKDVISKYCGNTNEHGITSDELIIAYTMLIYSGFRKEEAVNISLNDIICNDNYIIIKNDRIAINIYSEFIDIFKKIYNNRTYAKISLADNSCVKMSNYYISTGENDTPEESQKKLLKAFNRKLPSDIKLSADNIYLMGCVYKGKLYNNSFEEIYNESSKGICINQKVFRENLKMMYDNW